MIRLIRDKRTGDYYTEDRQYHIEKGAAGWNVNERNERLTEIIGIVVYSYSFSCDTLKEVKASL